MYVAYRLSEILLLPFFSCPSMALGWLRKKLLPTTTITHTKRFRVYTPNVRQLQRGKRRTWIPFFWKMFNGYSIPRPNLHPISFRSQHFSIGWFALLVTCQAAELGSASCAQPATLSRGALLLGADGCIDYTYYTFIYIYMCVCVCVYTVGAHNGNINTDDSCIGRGSGGCSLAIIRLRRLIWMELDFGICGCRLWMQFAICNGE